MERDRLLRNKEQFLYTGAGKILDNRRVDDDRLRGKTQAEERKTE